MSKAADNEAFVREFQRRAGISEDGWAGRREAWPALDRLVPAPVSTAYEVTERVALEILHHEAIVREAYKDSVGVWTWGVGVTSASGHHVERYKDDPQPLEKVLEIFVWLLKTKYGPDVKAAFGGRDLTEAEFAASLSFHYNTGAIKTADWVESWLAGQVDKARAEIMNWRKPASIAGRRTAERDLFFSGVWSQDGLTTEYQVSKPSYSPKWSSARKVDVRPALKAVLA